MKLFSRVDMDADLAPFRQAGESTVQPTEQQVAASCFLAAQSSPETEDAAGREPQVKRAGSLALRTQQFLSILERGLGCEVRTGKGSEIVIFRSGGHHFRLGHHKRNHYIPAALVKTILRRVGIGFQEWVRAID